LRTLKFALLGLLNQQSMTGYDITRQFKHTINEFWHANHSQIYPELKKLTDEGLVVFRIENGENLINKKVYTITDKGRADFIKWLEKDEPIPVTPKEVFRLRTFFCSDMDTVRREELFRSQLVQHEDRLQYLINNKVNSFGDVVPTPEDKNFGDYLVLLNAIMREQTLIEWLKHCIYLCNNSNPEL